MGGLNGLVCSSLGGDHMPLTVSISGRYITVVCSRSRRFYVLKVHEIKGGKNGGRYKK